MASNGFVALVVDGPGFQNRFGCTDNVLDNPECLVDVSYDLGIIDMLVRSTQIHRSALRL
jgi:hypothetical protein